MNERSGTLFSWSTIEFGCWVLILLFPVLYWVHGPAVSPDQWFVRTVLVVAAVSGAVTAWYAINLKKSVGLLDRCQSTSIL